MHSSPHEQELGWDLVTTPIDPSQPNNLNTPDPSTSLPTTSKTPWRCYYFDVESDLNLATTPKNSAQIINAPNLEICDNFSLIASPDNSLYVFGGSGTTQHLRQLKLDSANSMATIRNIRANGVRPSPRWDHQAVVIGTSFMVVWGGYFNHYFSDEYFHVFNLSKFILSLSKAVTTVVK